MVSFFVFSVGGGLACYSIAVVLLGRHIGLPLRFHRTCHIDRMGEGLSLPTGEGGAVTCHCAFTFHFSLFTFHLILFLFLLRAQGGQAYVVLDRKHSCQEHRATASKQCNGVCYAHPVT